jgi:hypothetical protein
MLDGEALNPPGYLFTLRALLYEYKNLKFKRYVGTQLLSSSMCIAALSPTLYTGRVVYFVRQLACHNETYAICLTFISDQLYTRPAAYDSAMHDEQNMNILWRASLFSF